MLNHYINKIINIALFSNMELFPILQFFHKIESLMLPIFKKVVRKRSPNLPLMDIKIRFLRKSRKTVATFF